MAATHPSSEDSPTDRSSARPQDTLSVNSVLAICDTQQQSITDLQKELQEEQTRRFQAETKILDQLSSLHTLTQGLRSRVALLDIGGSDTASDNVTLNRDSNVVIGTDPDFENVQGGISKETQSSAAPTNISTSPEAQSTHSVPESATTVKKNIHAEVKPNVIGPNSPKNNLSHADQLEDAHGTAKSNAEYTDQPTDFGPSSLTNIFNRSSTITRSRKSSESQSPGPGSVDTPDTDFSNLSDDDSSISSDTDTESDLESYKQNLTEEESAHDPQGEETTVDVSTLSQFVPAKKSVRWSPAEDDILRAILERLLKKKTTNKEAAFEQAVSLMKAQGYPRTSHAIALRWYQKLVKNQSSKPESHPKVSEEDTTGTRKPDIIKAHTSDESAAPLRTKRKSANHHQENDQSLQSTALVAEDEAPESSSAAKAPYRSDRSSESLLSVRLGSGRQTTNTTRSAALALQNDGGRYFAWDKTWTGASNDVIDIAWSPDSTKYVAGSCTVDDPSYNRPNNLLLGDLASNQLRNLPGHRLSNAQSAAQSTFLDPWVYSTVSSVAWSGDWIYTAGFDCTVKVWDPNNVANSVYTLPHDSRVEVMAVANSPLNLLATGTDSGDYSLRLYHDAAVGGHGSRIPLPSVRGKACFTYSPTCMKFGNVPTYANHLLVGFGSNSILEDGSPSPRGFLGLWRCDEARVTQIPLNPAGQQVFDVAWSEQSNMFISGNTIGRRRSGIGGSLVRVYDGGRSDNVLEAYCPALDMSEVSICPFDERVLSAACTDGNTYVWDTRNLDTPLHVLSHGRNVSEHDTELTDTGVRVLQWGRHRSELFTGSSDGVLNQWDIFQATTNTLTKEVVSTGNELMCGKLSPDKNSFFLGDASGSLQILSRSPTLSKEHPEDIDFVYAGRTPTSTSSEQTDTNTEGWGGREAAQELLETGQIALYPGSIVGQGPNYSGPYAAWARAPASPDEDLKDVPLLPKYRFIQTEAVKQGVKRKHSEIDGTRQSKIVSFKVKKRAIDSVANRGSWEKYVSENPYGKFAVKPASGEPSAVELLQHTMKETRQLHPRSPGAARAGRSSSGSSQRIRRLPPRLAAWMAAQKPQMATRPRRSTMCSASWSASSGARARPSAWHRGSSCTPALYPLAAARHPCSAAGWGPGPSRPMLASDTALGTSGWHPTPPSDQLRHGSSTPRCPMAASAGGRAQSRGCASARHRQAPQRRSPWDAHSWAGCLHRLPARRSARPALEGRPHACKLCGTCWPQCCLIRACAV